MTDVKPIKIDVFSDIACPYCFVGEKHLLMAKEKFLKENPNYPIERANVYYKDWLDNYIIINKWDYIKLHDKIYK